MTAGVSLESYAASATFAAVTGSVDANYPLSNMGDLWRSSQVSRITPSGGAIAITATLSAAQPMQFAALVNHGLPAGATVRVRFYSDVLTTVVQDIGPTAIPTPLAAYRQTFPAPMASEQSVRAVRVDIASAGAGAVDIGGLEISRFWTWPGISPNASVGLKPTTPMLDYVGGGSSGESNPLVRTYQGQIDKLAMTVAATSGLDMHGLKGTAQPLVFVEDLSDAASWSRRCFLAHNSELPAFVGAVYRHDTFQFRLVEWLR